MSVPAERLKTTTVRVSLFTKNWAHNHDMSISSILRAAPAWYDRTIRQGEELRELRANVEAAQKRIFSLLEENRELQGFKTRTIQRMKEAPKLEKSVFQ